MGNVLLFLFLLQVKHFFVDFVNQTLAEIEGKKFYGNLTGIGHSLKHGIGTAICACIALDFDLDYIALYIFFGAVDFILHYHIDWIKSNFTETDMTQKAYWVDFGGDQLAHQLTYLLLAVIIV